jgi:hypothetical protein
MSSYYPSFNYKGTNSKEKNLIVTHFSDGADTGEMDTFLNMEPVYTDNAYGTRRLDYGAKYSSVAVFRLTVVKQDGGEFSVSSIRDCLKWLTGSRTNSTLDLVDSAKETFTILADDNAPSFTMSNLYSRIDTVFVNGEESASWNYDTNSRKLSLHYGLKKGDTVDVIADIIKYSFIGRITNAWQYKMDARTVGLILEFTSVSPWAYSPPRVLTETISGSKTIKINNSSDDLYEYVYPKIVYKNNTSEGSLKITNKTTQETTQINGLDINEIVTMSNNMTITSDKPSKIFGNTFNFVFPRLAPGVNNLTIVGTGNITFEYVMYYKIGDCAIDINAKLDPICSEDGRIILDTLDWGRIVNTPNTLVGYGITDAYTKTETDSALALKANITDVNAALSAKANKTDVDRALSVKADKAEVDSALALKADKTELTAGLKTKQNAIYLSNTVTSIDDFIALNSTHTVYTGMMSGFSTKFGASSDSVTKGFRMWFVLSKPNNNTEWYRIIMLNDGTVWTATKTGTTFTQMGYSKTQINQLLKSKADLDAYENVIEISEDVSSAEQFNNYTDTNKTYTFFITITNSLLGNELNLDKSYTNAMTRCILNNYQINSKKIQVLRILSGSLTDTNKIFMRDYNSASWSTFEEITIPEGSVSLTKLSSDVQDIINSVADKADKATTLAGYGIIDTYTKTELNALLNNKLDNIAGSVKSLNIDSGAVTLSKLSDDVQDLINSGGSGGNDNFTKTLTGKYIISIADGAANGTPLSVTQYVDSAESVTTKYYFSHYNGSANIYDEMKEKDGAYIFFTNSTSLENNMKFKLTSSNAEGSADNLSTCISKNSPTITVSDSAAALGVKVEIETEYGDITISGTDETMFKITFIPSANNAVTGEIIVSLSDTQFNSVGLIGTIDGSGDWNSESYEFEYFDGVWSIIITFTGGTNDFKARANDNWNISFGGGSSTSAVVIDEQDLNDMLTEVLV